MKMLSSVETKRLLQLADHLETVSPSAFDIGAWQTQEYRPAVAPATFLGLFAINRGDPGCGFAGCAMGWAAHSNLFSGLALEGNQLVYKGASGYAAADKLFGFAGHNRKKRKKWKNNHFTNTAYFLFGPSSYYTGSPSPSDVADRIRRLVSKVESSVCRAIVEKTPTLRLVASA